MGTQTKPVRRQMHRLYDDHGKSIGFVTDNGELFTNAANRSLPVTPQPTKQSRRQWAIMGPQMGGVRLNRRHARLRVAADKAGHQRSKDVIEWEDELTRKVLGAEHLNCFSLAG